MTLVGACLMAALIGFLVQCSKGAKRRKEDKALEDETSDFLQGNPAPWSESKPPTTVPVFNPVGASNARGSENFYDHHSAYGQEQKQVYTHEVEPYEDNEPISQSYVSQIIWITVIFDLSVAPQADVTSMKNSTNQT